MMRFIASWPALIAVYLLLLTISLLTLWQIRDWSIQSFAEPDAQAAWDEWREEAGDSIAREQADGSKRRKPVERKVPRSDLPPTYALLKDHFLTSVGGLVLIGSVAYWSTAWMLRGVAMSSAQSDRLE